QQVILEPGKQVRIADFRLALQDTTAVAEREVGAITPDGSSPSWLGLEPGWLDQLLTFQRALLHLEEPQQVLERVAHEFLNLTRPEIAAVGLVTSEGYSWEVVTGDECDHFGSLREASQRVTLDDSEVQCWNDASTNGDTPLPVAPLSLLFPMKGR